MILDRMEGGRFYGDDIAKGLAFIRKAIANGIADGRYEIEGDDIYAQVHTYDTKAAELKRPESHRKYIDIQAMLAGEEIIEWIPIVGLAVDVPYSDDNDAILYKSAAGASRLYMKPGLYAVFHPNDGHKPGCSIDAPATVRKIVVKVKA